MILMILNVFRSRSTATASINRNPTSCMAEAYRSATRENMNENPKMMANPTPLK